MCYMTKEGSECASSLLLACFDNHQDLLSPSMDIHWSAHSQSSGVCSVIIIIVGSQSTISQMSPRCIHFILKLKKCQCGHPLSLFTASHQAFTQCAHPLSQLTLASVTASHQCGHPLSLFTTSHQAFTEYGHPFSLFTASHQVEAQSPP